MRINLVISVTWIHSHQAPTIPGQTVEEPPLLIVGNEEEYKVEEVLDSRMKRQKLEYLVKWKGYTDEHNTWESADNFGHAKQKVTNFHCKHPSAPYKIQTLDELRFRLIENFTEFTHKETL